MREHEKAQVQVLKSRIAALEAEKLDEQQRLRDVVRRELIGFFNPGGDGESIDMVTAQNCLRLVDRAIRGIDPKDKGRGDMEDW